MKNLIVLLGLFLMTFSLQAQADCDCEIDPLAEWVCAVDGEGNVVPVPNECFATCLEFTLSDEECNFDFPGGEFEDCDCEIDKEEEWICVLTDVETGLTCPFPNLCFAECAGYSVDDVITEGCEEFDWEIDFPDGNYEDCDCEEDELGEGICIEVDYEGAAFQMWIPSECHADCWEVGEYTVVECDDWDGGEFPDGNYEDCDCEIDPLAEWVCAVDGEGNIFPVPNECFATCFELTLSDEACDGDFPDGGGEFPNGGWENCDCEISDIDETVCVLTDVETGEICPFPNMCFAECLGYTPDDVVECDDTWVWNDDTEFPDGGFDCEDCFEDEGEVVCVILEGQTFELPNACFAECLGLEVVDCSDLDNSTPPVIDMDRQTSSGVQIFFAGSGNVAYTVADNSNTETTVTGDINVFPNPVQDVLNINLEMLQDAEATINVIDNTGRIISTNEISLTKGINTTNINTSKYTGGIYHLQVLTNEEVMTSKFVKL